MPTPRVSSGVGRLIDAGRPPTAVPRQEVWVVGFPAPDDAGDVAAWRLVHDLARETGKVTELDLVTALRELPENERGWQTERRSVQCQSCRAVMVFDPARVGQNCEFCGSPALVPYEEIKSPIRPQGVLPFRVDTDRVRDDIRRWWRSKWRIPRCAIQLL